MPQVLDFDSDVSFNLAMAAVSMIHSGGSIAFTYLLDPRMKMSNCAVCCRIFLVPFLSLVFTVVMLVPMSGHIYVNMGQELDIESDSQREFFLFMFISGLMCFLVFVFWWILGYKKREEQARSAEYY